MMAPVNHVLLILIAAFIPLGNTCAGQKPLDEKGYEKLRAEMIRQQIVGRDVTDQAVLSAIGKVPRHLFVPQPYRNEAYIDHPIPIGEDQTISQPYIVAKMTELAGVKKGSKVLEIGTGSGYQAAVLAELGVDVYSIEIIESLSRQAKKSLEEAGYSNVKLRMGDGYRGWPEAAPFDAILVTAAPERVPEPLKDQLKVGGRLVIPVGARSLFQHQELQVITRTKNGFDTRTVFPVAFVPMTGESEKK